MARRITVSLDDETAERIDAWSKQYGVRSAAEAVRLLIAHAVSQPPDRALQMAYAQSYAELATFGRNAVSRALGELTVEARRRRR